MNLAMAVFARRKFYTGRSLHTEWAMDADGLSLNYVIVTGCALDRVEPAPVPKLGADMAVEAVGRAMNCGLELCEVNFVAIVTGIRLFFVARE
jgi:hypothetical protein